MIISNGINVEYLVIRYLTLDLSTRGNGSLAFASGIPPRLLHSLALT